MYLILSGSLEACKNCLAACIAEVDVTMISSAEQLVPYYYSKL